MGAEHSPWLGVEVVGTVAEVVGEADGLVSVGEQRIASWCVG